MFGIFGTPSKEKFADIVLKAIKDGGGPTDFEFDPAAFAIKRGDHRGYLGNTYIAYSKAGRAHKKVILHNFVAAMVAQHSEFDATFEDVRSEIVTVVRERALFSFTTLLWQIDGMPSPPVVQSEAISQWFARALVIDAPTHMSLVNESQIRDWHQTSEELYALGLAKLKDAKPPAFRESDGVFRGLWHDDYDSSRILVPGIFDDLPLRGDPVVAMPNRLTLLVADSENPDAIGRMLAEAEKIVRNEAKPQNPAPLVVQEGVISDYSVPPDSPCYSAVERAKRIAALMYYQEQKESLEELYEKNGKEFFVASYTLNELAGGEYRSIAVLTKGVPTLLPIVDEIAFIDSDKPEHQQLVARASWDKVQRLIGDEFLDTQMFPARYFVSNFPNAEQLANLASE